MGAEQGVFSGRIHKRDLISGREEKNHFLCNSSRDLFSSVTRSFSYVEQILTLSCLSFLYLSFIL
jgi:hypothetical protein